MKNVTVSLDDDTYHRARVAAAESGRTVTSVVRELLQGFTADAANRKQGKTLDELFAEIDALPGRSGVSVHMTRDEMYDDILGRGPGKGRG
jgi:plasmid stability protein